MNKDIYNYWSQKSEKKVERKDLKTLLSSVPLITKFMIVGGPGVGKTTLLSNLLINCTPINKIDKRLFLTSEGKRPTTEEEQEKWNKQMVSTSRCHNFGMLITEPKIVNNEMILFDFPKKENVNEKKDITITLWDTMGQKKYQAINRDQYLDVSGFLFVLDGTLSLTNERIMDNINIFTDITSFFGNQGYKIPPILFLVNKQDRKPICKSAIMYKTILGSYWPEIKSYDFIPASALTEPNSLKIAIATLLRKAIYSDIFRNKKR